jgi:hypothetical protein
MPGKYDAYVLARGDEGDRAGTPQEFIVRPPVAGAIAGKHFRIRNVTRKPVVVVFPGDLVEGRRRLLSLRADKRKRMPYTLSLAPGKGGKVRIRDRADGVYAYDVTVGPPKGCVRAAGESSPKIIVDP